MDSAWRSVGEYVERRGHGATRRKFSVQAWEAVSPIDSARRIVVAELRFESGEEVEAVYRFTSEDLTRVDAVHFASGLFRVPVAWADLEPGQAGMSPLFLLVKAMEEIEDSMPGGWPLHTLRSNPASAPA